MLVQLVVIDGLGLPLLPTMPCSLHAHHAMLVIMGPCMHAYQGSMCYMQRTCWR